jgi:hypothetical protein
VASLHRSSSSRLIWHALLPDQADGRVVYMTHPFWKQERFCPAHQGDGTLRCTACQRLCPRCRNLESKPLPLDVWSRPPARRKGLQAQCCQGCVLLLSRRPGLAWESPPGLCQHLCSKQPPLACLAGPLHDWSWVRGGIPMQGIRTNQKAEFGFLA